MADSSIYARRRQAFMERMGPSGVALIHSPPEVLRNGDSHYRFRQSSDLFYLTGFAEPEATLVLRPGEADRQVVLFVRDRDPEREVWDGRRAGVAGAVADFAADVAYPIADLERELPALIANVDDLYYGLGYDNAFDSLVVRLLASLRGAERRGLRPPLRLVDPRFSLHELRLRKGPDEIETLRRAAEITGEAHRAAMRAAGEGVREYELDGILSYTFRRRGGSGPGYTSIVGSGENATILHYIENNRTMHEGELVLIDAGCEYEHYTADVTRTFPVSGTFSARQRQCYELVLRAEEEAIAMARPGQTLDALHARCVEILCEGMVALGLLEGDAAERVADGSYKRFYMHRTSHWLGMDVHDAGAYTVDGEARPLEAGMVITIEPGLYIAADAEGVPDELRGLGIRIEDDVVITEEGCEVLTASIPKTVAELEEACRS